MEVFLLRVRHASLSSCLFVLFVYQEVAPLRSELPGVLKHHLNFEGFILFLKQKLPARLHLIAPRLCLVVLQGRKE